MANSAAHIQGASDTGYDVIEVSLDSFTSLADLGIGACTLHAIEGAVSSGTDFILMWDDESPVLGTTAPDYQIPTNTGVRVLFPGGLPFTNGLTITGSNVGGTAASGAPSNTNTVKLVLEL